MRLRLIIGPLHLGEHSDEEANPMRQLFISGEGAKHVYLSTRSYQTLAKLGDDRIAKLELAM